MSKMQPFLDILNIASINVKKQVYNERGVSDR